VQGMGTQTMPLPDVFIGDFSPCSSLCVPSSLPWLFSA
jgi:hypothetical protein